MPGTRGIFQKEEKENMIWTGDRIRKTRKEFDLSQKILGLKLGITEGTLSMYELSKKPIPEKHQIKLDEIFKLDANDHVSISEENLIYIMRTLGKAKTCLNAILKIDDLNEMIDESLNIIGDSLK